MRRFLRKALISLAWVITATTLLHSQLPLVPGSPRSLEPGVLDLRDWNQETETLVPLEGLWLLRCFEDASDPEYLLADTSAFSVNPGLAEVPLVLRGRAFEEGTGLSLYETQIMLPQGFGQDRSPAASLGLFLGFIPKAYEVFLDGVFVFQHGRLPNTALTEYAREQITGLVQGHSTTEASSQDRRAQSQQARAAAGDQTLFFSPPGTTFNLQILVWNPDYPRAGIHEAPLLGSAHEIRSFARVRAVWDGVLTCGLMVIGLLLLGAYVRRPQDARAGLWGLASLLMGLRHGLGGSFFLHAMIPGINFDHAYLIGYCLVYLSAALVASYVDATGIVRLGERPLRIIWAAALIGCLLSLSGDLGLAFRAMVSFHVLVIFYTLAIVIMYLLGKERGPGYRLFGFSFLVMAAGSLFDFLELSWISGASLVVTLLLLCGFLLQTLYLLGQMVFAMDRARRRNQDLQAVLMLQDRIQVSLEQTVRSRNEALYRALEEARSANQAKTQFLANISHEIRTPLNGILGFTDLLERSIDPRVTRLYVDLIRKESDRLLEMIDQLLDISKIEAKKLTLDARPVDLATRLREFQRQIEFSAEKKDLDFNFSLDPDLPATVLIDIQRFMQILHNLLSNSLKFTLRGGIGLEIKVLGADPQSRAFDLSIRVSDTGIGIPQHQIDKIFDSFEQGSPAIGRRFGGSGLGMSITRDLVQVMGGSIKVESEEGKGTDFEICLPLTWTDEAEPEEQERLHGGMEPRWQRDTTVLLVDDYELNTFMLTRYLDGLGFDIHAVASGDEALDFTRSRKPDLILMDIHMPGKDGLEATQILRSQSYRGKIIGLSASAFAHDRQGALEAGMDAFLAKPVRRRDLLDLLGEMIPPDYYADSREGLGRLEVSPPLLDDLAGDLKTYLELLGEFVRSARTLREGIRDSVARSKAKEVKALSHALRGGAAALGAEVIVNLARDLENAAQAQDLAKMRDKLLMLDQELEEVFIAVDSLGA